MTGFWACTSRLFPWVHPASSASSALSVRHGHGHGIGHWFRKRLVRRWGVSHAAAVTAWGNVTTCVWIGAPLAGGGLAGAGWLLWPGSDVGQSFVQGAGSSVVASVAVPEPSTFLVLAVGVGVTIALRRRQ